MAADKRSVHANARGAIATKVHKINGCLVGMSGAYDVSMELLHWFSEGCVAEDFPEIQVETSEATLLVITPERRITIYERSPIPLVFEQNFTAAGSGRDFALAALHMGATPEKAVEVAGAFDIYTGDGVDVIRLD